MCNEVNNCGDDSDESSCGTLDTGKFIGGTFGGAAGFITLLIAIIVITIVVCVCNKRCPLYKQRRREPPPVVVVDGVQPAPEENARESVSLIQNDEVNTKYGV